MCLLIVIISIMTFCSSLCNLDMWDFLWSHYQSQNRRSNIINMVWFWKKTSILKNEKGFQILKVNIYLHIICIKSFTRLWILANFIHMKALNQYFQFKIIHNYWYNKSSEHELKLVHKNWNVQICTDLYICPSYLGIMIEEKVHQWKYSV